MYKKGLGGATVKKGYEKHPTLVNLGRSMESKRNNDLNRQFTGEELKHAADVATRGFQSDEVALGMRVHKKDLLAILASKELQQQIEGYEIHHRRSTGGGFTP